MTEKHHTYQGITTVKGIKVQAFLIHLFSNQYLLDLCFLVSGEGLQTDTSGNTLL